MECKFLKHGIALSYDQIIKPCCAWKVSGEWQKDNHYQKINLAEWHTSTQVISKKQILESDQWPNDCVECKKIEVQNRNDSMRGNGNQAYADYKDDDITLEIRPGNTCNFACQTCWPEASSRVLQYHAQAGLVDLNSVNTNRLDDFEFLLPIASRIRNVVLLGGEPFYDKSCKKFLIWAQQNLKSDIMMFTNGSVIDLDFLKNYPGKLTVIFSLDAVGKPAEYIRYGTVWEEVLKNYLTVKSLPNIEVRVNITCSVYNYLHLEKLIEFLSPDWPSIVSFGTPFESYLKESSIPMHLRDRVKTSLLSTMEILTGANIPNDQKTNAINAIMSIKNNLDLVEFNQTDYKSLQNLMNKMDFVKQIAAVDYCKFLGQLQQQTT